MTIAYKLGSKVYLNITNICPCSCVFCLRETQSGVGDAASLWLEREPSIDEIKSTLDAYPFEGINEIVFCGYGEPMERADVVLEVSRYIKLELFAQKNKPAPPVRINTNGLAYLMSPGFDVSRLAVVDTVSISLNADDSAEYMRVARPRFGVQSYDALLNFAKESSAYTNVVFTVVEGMSQERLENCMRIADDLGVSFRLRPYE